MNTDFDLDASLEPAVHEFSFTGTCGAFDRWVFLVIRNTGTVPADRREDVFHGAGRIEREYAPHINEAWLRAQGEAEYLRHTAQVREARERFLQMELNQLEHLRWWEKAVAVLISPRLWLIWLLGHFHRRAPMPVEPVEPWPHS